MMDTKIPRPNARTPTTCNILKIFNILWLSVAMASFPINTLWCCCCRCQTLHYYFRWGLYSVHSIERYNEITMFQNKTLINTQTASVVKCPMNLLLLSFHASVSYFKAFIYSNMLNSISEYLINSEHSGGTMEYWELHKESKHPIDEWYWIQCKPKLIH